MIHLLNFALFLFILYSGKCNPFYRTLLYGEKFKGFLLISPVGNDEYIVSFDVIESGGDVRWAVHIASAPYDMAVMTDNCKRVKKSPHILRNMTLADTTVHGWEIIGHTIVLANANETLACATVILPGQPLMRASFHASPIEGHIHVIPLKDKVRFLPDLKYLASFEEIAPEKEIIDWAFVEKCSSPNVQQNTDGSELGVDSRIAITLEIPTNYSLHSFALFRDGKPFACSPIQNVEVRNIKAEDIILSQPHYFEPVHISTEHGPEQLSIRDDCLDLSTEAIHKKYENFYPSVNIFGPESIMLKSLVINGSCSTLRPQFPRPAATAYFIHPIIGRLVIVDTDDKILITGELRHVFDASATRATIQVSDKWTGPTGCPQYLECSDCYTIEDAAVIVGKDEPSVTLNGVLPWFEIGTVRSIIVDLQWTKVCANLTQLPGGALSAHALIKRISPVSSSTVASIVVLEYPANNYTEALVNKHQSFSAAAAHSRPLDSSITSGPPCGEQNLGPSQKKWWINRLTTILGGNDNDTTVIIGSHQLVTGIDSVLGTSVLLTKKKEVFCGHFKPLTEKTIAVAKFSEPFSGYIKLTQYGTLNWASGIPTEVYYSIARSKETTSSTVQEEINWDFVNQENMTCKGALLYNPFQVNETECISGRSQFCPVGSATHKSGPLILGARRHLVVNDLPLSGPFSLIGKSIRLHSRDKPVTITCEPVKRFSEATFRWVVLSNRTLSEVQSIVAEKVGVELFQVEVDYTRELFQAHCSIYRITILDEDDCLADILAMFDVEEKKFKSDQALSCSWNDNSSLIEAHVSAAPDSSKTTGHTSVSLFLTLFTISLSFYIFI